MASAPVAVGCAEGEVVTVRIVDWLGNPYLVYGAEARSSAMGGTVLVGFYQPEGELVGLGDGAFRLDVCESWEPLPSPLNRTSVRSSIPASIHKTPRQRSHAPGPVTGTGAR